MDDRWIGNGNTSLKSSYFKVHKILLEHPLYKEKLSHSAIIVYGLLRDRMNLSENNGWMDGDGRYFIYYTLEAMSDLVGVSTRTVIKYYNQLEEVNLIERKRQRMGLPNKVYVREPESFDLKKVLPEMQERYEKYLKENTDVYEYEEYKEMLRKEGVLQGEETFTSSSEDSDKNSNVKKTSHEESSNVKKPSPRTRTKLRTSNTDISNTDLQPNNTEWESATHPSKKKEEKSVLATRGKKKEKPKSQLANKSDFVSSQQNKAKKTLDEVVSDVKSTKRKKTPSMLFSHYVALFNQNFDRKAPVTTAKDKTLLKKLMNHYDYDTVMRMLDWMFEYWDYFKDTKNIDGAPTVGLFYGFESYIRDEVEKVRKQSSSSTVW